MTASLLAASLAVTVPGAGHAYSVDTQNVSNAIDPVPLVGLTSLSEGFANIGTLASGGWSLQNNSNPATLNPTATANWFQGNPTNVGFSAQAGAANSYIAVDFVSTAGDPDTGVGTVSNWLITPEFDFSQGGAFSYYTRTVLGNSRPEILEVRLSAAGASTNVGATESSVGDFTSLLRTIGSTTDITIYPGATSAINEYAKFTENIAALTGGTGSGRLAFRWTLPTSGPAGTTGQLIGIDTVSFEAIPEPATTGFASVLLLGSIGSTLRRRLRGRAESESRAEGTLGS